MDIDDLPKVFCPRCGEEIGENAYVDLDNCLIGCDNCCTYDMEQNGCPLVDIGNSAVIAFGKDVKAKSYWHLMEDAIPEYDEFCYALGCESEEYRNDI